MEEWFRDFSQYCKAVIKWWVKTVGGSVVSVFLLCYAIKYKESPPMIYWCLFFACFLLAGFLGWRDERKEVRRLTLPRLVGRIGHWAFCDNNETAGLCVFLELECIHSQTTAKGWQLRFRMGARLFSFKATHLLEESITWPVGDGSVVSIRAEDMIYEKLTKAIPSGDCVTGFLFFDMKKEGISLQDLSAEKPTLTVLFRDVTDKKYEASTDDWGTIKPMHQPGTNDPFLAVTLRQLKSRQKAIIASPTKDKNTDRQIILRVVKLLSEHLPTPKNIPEKFTFAMQDIKSYDPTGALIEVSDQFENERQVISVCDSLVSAGYSPPFATLEEIFGLGAFNGKRLKFLQDARIIPGSIYYEGQAVLYVCRVWGGHNGIAVTEEILRSQKLKELAEEWD